jgi:hypothetical protein
LGENLMPDVPNKSKPESAESAPKPEDVPLGITNMDAARRVANDIESYQRFRIQTAMELCEKLLKQVDAGTALYEKLILLDGAIIALSITFLGSLSTHLTTAHVGTRPHLWLVAVSWLLLIMSVYCCHRVIVDRHGASYRVLTKLSSECHQYMYQRTGILLSSVGAVFTGEVPIGAERVQISKIMEQLNVALKQEGETVAKRMDDYITEGKKTYKEGLFAHAATGFTILAVVLLCAFTILSLDLLF